MARHFPIIPRILTKLIHEGSASLHNCTDSMGIPAEAAAYVMEESFSGKLHTKVHATVKCSAELYQYTGPMSERADDFEQNCARGEIF